MAAFVASNPLRAQLPGDLAPLAISYTATPATAGTFASAQSDCNLVSVAGDLTASIMKSLCVDVFLNFTLPGLASFIQSSRTCKYLRDLSRFITTPIDAAIIERDENSVPGDENLNRQRSFLYALHTSDGRPAGLRYRLVSADMLTLNDGVYPEVEKVDDPFLLVYRDVRQDFDRPVVMAIAKPQPNGSLLCLEISLVEMLHFLGGHSKKSVFNARPVLVGSTVTPKWQYAQNNDQAKISVWGNSESMIGLVDKATLEEDSMNPITIEALDPNTTILAQGYTPNGKLVHIFNGCLWFRFPSSTCFEFDPSNNMAIDNPAHVMALLGCHEEPDVAAIRTPKGPMIANTERLVLNRPCRARDENLNTEISPLNIQPAGRRAAVQRADIAVQRNAVDDELTFDGQFLPGHPEYDRIKAEVDEINERLEAEGRQFSYIDPRIKPPTPPKRIRSVLTLTNT